MKYYYDNPETGLEEISKEVYDAIHSYSILFPILGDRNGNRIGKIFLTGTTTALNDAQTYKKLWEK